MSENVENASPESVVIPPLEPQEPVTPPEGDAPLAEEPKGSEPEISEDSSIDDLPLPGDEKKEDKKSDLPKWAEKRIAKKEKEIQQKAAEAEAYKVEIERLRQAQLNAPASVDKDAPAREDFDSEPDYIAAMVDHVNKKNMVKYQGAMAEQQRFAAEKEFKDKWSKSEEEGLKKYDDFDDKMEVLNSPTMPGNRLMAEAIVDSPFKTDILYFLGTYPDHAAKIAKMSPTQAIKEIAKLEVRFAEQKKSKVKTSPKILEPVKTNKGAASEGNPNTMSPEEFNEWYANRKRK